MTGTAGFTGTKTWSLTLLSVASLLAMSLWFSASAVVPQLTAEWGLGATARSWMTMTVQVGFVVGALTSAMLNLADRIPPRRLIAMSALAGAAANAAIALYVSQPAPALGLRFLTGVALAGVYPPGMKLAAGWCREDRGRGIGILVGALAVGSATPHLLNALSSGGAGMPAWRPVLLITSLLAVAAALIIGLLVRDGPHMAPGAPFNWRFAGRALGHEPTRLANFGYLGHMWELYAMWAWVPILLIASYERADWSLSAARLAGFGVIASGSLGCVVAGVLADRIGRTTVTIASLVISGACAAVAGLFFDQPGVLTVVCLVWGVAVVADSAQFSAAVSELTDPRYVGTALTLQTSLGFLLTLATIWVVPPLAVIVGWERVFLVLVPGPIFGAWAMWRLRRLPESTRMASGRR